MTNKIPRGIAFVTSIHSLVPSDIIALGAYHRGLHALQDRYEVDIEVEGGLGRLAISMRGDLKRSR